ncbi:MAG TPA: Cys-tRNA(Pro) deacylase [Saprospiraceae bacterium]|nr:Cys-tRNA(Pro) deacylase [Saprospiraceae bacterium]
MSKKTNALRILEANKASFETVEYNYEADDLSVEHIAEANALPLERIYKTLVAKGDKQGVVVAVIPGHCSLSFKALAKASGNKKITLVPVKDIQGLTGYIRGGCSPIGMKKDYPTFIDASAQLHDKIFVNAGQRGLLVGLAPADLLRLTQGVLEEIAEG